MYAVIKTGGKQYKVSEGETLEVEKLTKEVGDIVELSEVLAVGEGVEIKVGTPTVTDASVVAEIVGHGRGKKVVVFKKKRRKGYKKKQGHRQAFTSIRIKEIKALAGQPPSEEGGSGGQPPLEEGGSGGA
jgi:large subunit ribosomal protein L21